MAWVYVIRSQEGFRYTGSTTDLEKRLFQHKNHLAGWTKRGTAWDLIYKEEYETYPEARRREMWLKTGAGRRFLDEILSVAHNPPPVSSNEVLNSYLDKMI